MDGALAGGTSALDSEGSFLTDLQTNALTVGTNGASNVTASVQLARIIYVDQARGNDGYTGKSPIRSLGDGPKKTVPAGMEAVAEGGALIIKEGRYQGGLNVAGRDVVVRVEGNVRLLGNSPPMNSSVIGSGIETNVVPVAVEE